jgi:hypothetical protein
MQYLPCVTPAGYGDERTKQSEYLGKLTDSREGKNHRSRNPATG